MQVQEKHGRLLAVRGGWIECPNCRKNRRLMKILPDTEGRHIVAYCRDCKKEILIDVKRGESFESRGQ